MGQQLLRTVMLLAALSCTGIAFAQKYYGGENKDDGVDPRGTYRFEDYHAPTPLTVPGGKTIHTEELYQALQGESKPLLIDVLGGAAHQTLEGAVWWPGSGVGYKGESASADAQTRFTRKLTELTGGDKTKRLVFFCLSSQCWLSYNASLRALAAGYPNVLWYRGGLESWKAAGNATNNSGPSKY